MYNLARRGHGVSAPALKEAFEFHLSFSIPNSSAFLSPRLDIYRLSILFHMEQARYFYILTNITKSVHWVSSF